MQKCATDNLRTTLFPAFVYTNNVITWRTPIIVWKKKNVRALEESETAFSDSTHTSKLVAQPSSPLLNICKVWTRSFQRSVPLTSACRNQLWPVSSSLVPNSHVAHAYPSAIRRTCARYSPRCPQCHDLFERWCACEQPYSFNCFWTEVFSPDRGNWLVEWGSATKRTCGANRADHRWHCRLGESG